MRDYLMGKTPSDWDITTSALPDEVIELFPDMKVLPTGISHGTVTVVCDRTPVEITTFRIDGEYEDNRHPQNVTFAKTIEEDLSRRDFTINAMAYNPSQGLVDPFGGKDDLEKKLLRCVGSPGLRFQEDALRIMRCLRFSATLNLEIEKSTSEAIFSRFLLLENISPERISAELSKLVLGDKFEELLIFYTPIFNSILGLKQGIGDLEKKAHRLKSCEKLLPLRLAILLMGTDAEGILRKLRYDNKIISAVNVILQNINTPLENSAPSIKKHMSVLGAEDFGLVLKAKITLGEASSPNLKEVWNIYQQILEAKECFRIDMLDIDGENLKKEFNLFGKEIGDALKTLLDAVICEKCKNSKADLINYIKTKEM